MNKFYLLSKFVCLTFMTVSVMALTSCQNDDIPSDSYYTFKGLTVAQYLDSDSGANYSIYNDFVKNCTQDNSGARISALLGSYGYYTVFAPTNAAMTTYLAGLGVTSREDLYNKYTEHEADSIVRVVTNMHVISSGNNETMYEVKNFNRKLPDKNLNNKVIYVEPSGDTYMINEQAKVIEKDVKLHNGYLHGIDCVIEPSDMKLTDFFVQYPQFSMFGKLLDYVGLMDNGRILTEPEVYEYQQAPETMRGPADHDRVNDLPSKKYQYYTMFIESDSVYEAQVDGFADATTLMDSIDAVKAYARAWYEREFFDATPQERAAALNEEWQSPTNFLNRFVSYHIVNMKIDRTDFTRYVIGMERNYKRVKEYYESIAPNQEIYLSALTNGHAWVSDGESVSDPDPNRVILNPNPESQDIIWDRAKDWGRPVKDGPRITERTYQSENGFFHEIASILAFPRQDFKKIRFRHSFSAIFPEIMSNDYRYRYTTQGRITFPHQQPYTYLSNIAVLSEATKMFMISPNTNAGPGGYNGHQGDEMFFIGAYDLVIRLPPVPAGTYEVRFGFSSSEHRGCAQFYIGTDADCDWAAAMAKTKVTADDFRGLVACGIPVDLTRNFTNRSGRSQTEAADANKTEEEILEFDKELRANGMMKGPNSWLGANGNDTRSLRAVLDGHSPYRVILGTVTLQKDGPIYMRAKGLVQADNVELMADYVEVVPDNVYNNPEMNEPRD